MKTKVLLTTALFAFLTLNSQAQEKQNRFGIELNGGISFATNPLNEANLNPGFGFEGLLHYRFLPHTGVYAGWGWNRFAAENSFAGNDVCFEETGYVWGLEYKHPFGSSPLSFYLRGGGLYNHIETENASGEIINDSRHGLGFQLATGIDVPLGSNWSLTPGVKFNSLSRETDFESEALQLDHRYISIRIGISKKF